MAGSAWTNQVVSLLIIQSAGNFQGLFVYSPTPGAGNLIGSWASTAGTDPYGNAYPQGLYATSVTFNLSGGRLLVYANETLTTILTSGTVWNAPPGLVGGVVNCRVVAPGGGASDDGGNAGGGGEDAQEPNLAVTAGHAYNYSLGTPGTGAAAASFSSGTNATNATFTGDSVTVTAHGGKGGAWNSVTRAAGGTGSTNTVHHDGGPGGLGGVGNGGSIPYNGAGGGSSGGTAAVGGTGGDFGAAYPNGGIAPTGGGNGGPGGLSSGANGTTGSVPGGGGGGGPGVAGSNWAGANGGAGEIVLTYQIANDLIASIAPTAGTDSGGNAYPAGFGGQLTAYQPATFPAVAEIWHQITPLSNGWTGSGSGVNGLFYRLLGSPPNTVEVIADIVNVTATGNSVCGTLPFGYQPGVTQNHTATMNTVAAQVWVNVATSGAIQITNIPGANNEIFFHIFIPLDGSL